MPANNIVIDGILDGSGTGFAGGPSVPYNTSGCPGDGTVTGIPGSGPGGGGGGLFGCNVHGSGGGGAGYGGNGGASSQAISPAGPTPGGVAYGDAVSPSVNQGSGGGSGSRYNQIPGASGAGGAGGAAISLFGTIDLNGAILTDGRDGGPGIPLNPFLGTPAGGGGSGGGVLLNGVLFLDGLISTIGGNGGSGSAFAAGSGGGGGAGGRIKLFGVCNLGVSFQVDVSKGIGGTSWSFSETFASDGQDGTFTNECVPIIVVAVDIKPQSCPNPINTKSKGVIPVAILGTDDFDVIDIEIESLRLVGVEPIRVDIEDVSTPFEPFLGKVNCTEDCNELGPDGFLDLTLKFDKQEVVEALGDVGDGACLVLDLTGNTTDDTPIVGEDVVLIKKKGK